MHCRLVVCGRRDPCALLNRRESSSENLLPPGRSTQFPAEREGAGRSFTSSALTRSINRSGENRLKLYGVQPGVSTSELYWSSAAPRLTICGPSPVFGVTLGTIGIVRLPIRASAAAIVDWIGHASDPLAMLNLAEMSCAARIKLASALLPVPVGVLRIASNCACV